MRPRFRDFGMSKIVESENKLYDLRDANLDRLGRNSKLSERK